jgi:hypothetical protein
VSTGSADGGVSVGRFTLVLHLGGGVAAGRGRQIAAGPPGARRPFKTPAVSQPRQIAFAWLRRNPVVAAPIVGAHQTKHIDDAVAALSISLTDDEAGRLEAPYTPRRDHQGASDPAMHARAVEATIGFKTAAAMFREN